MGLLVILTLWWVRTAFTRVCVNSRLVRRANLKSTSVIKWQLSKLQTTDREMNWLMSCTQKSDNKCRVSQCAATAQCSSSYLRINHWIGIVRTCIPKKLFSGNVLEVAV